MLLAISHQSFGGLLLLLSDSELVRAGLFPAELVSVSFSYSQAPALIRCDRTPSHGQHPGSPYLHRSTPETI